MNYQLKPNKSSLGKTGEPEAIDICDGGSVWASVHVDMFWLGNSGRDPRSIYSRLRRGEEVEVSIVAVKEEDK